MKTFLNKLVLGVVSLQRPRFKILAYHGVVRENPDPYEVTVAMFRDQMRLMRDQGFQVFDLHHAVQNMQAGHIAQKSIVITFDDAHESILENAIPILTQYGFPATIFVPTGLVGKKDIFSDELCNQKNIMRWSELESLVESGISIGSHSVNHFDMTTLDKGYLVDEVMKSYYTLVDHFGKQAYYFAYPFGMLNEMVRDVLLVSPYVGGVCFGSVLSNWSKTDPYLIKREKILATTGLKDFIRIIDPGCDLKRACKAHGAKLFR